MELGKAIAEQREPAPQPAELELPDRTPSPVYSDPNDDQQDGYLQDGEQHDGDGDGDVMLDFSGLGDDS